MKKIMFAAAVAAGMVAFGDAIESTNIVGYNNLVAEMGTKDFVGVPFVNTSAGAIDLQSIRFYDGDDLATAGCTLWWWDNDSGKNATVKWSDCYWEPDTSKWDQGNVDDEGYNWDEHAWGIETEDYDAYIWTNRTFAVGESAYVYMTAAEPKFFVSGQIVSTDSTSPTYAVHSFLNMSEKAMVCNPYPVDCQLQDIVLFDGESIPAAGCTLWWWDNEAGKNFTVKWSDCYYEPDTSKWDQGNVDDEGYNWDDPAWGIETDEYDAYIWTDKTIKAGQGVYVYFTAGTPVLKFPNPFYKE